MAVAFLALLAAIGGTAAALPGKNKVKKDDIAKGAVGASDLAKNSVTNAKIRNRSLTGTKFRLNALGGNALKESTLGKVPSAGTADTATNAVNAANATNAINAAALGNRPASAYQLGANEVRFGLIKMSAGAPDVTLATVGPFTLRAECDAGPDAHQTLTTTESDSYAASDEDTFDDFDAGVDFDASGGEDEDDEVNAASPSGTAITGQLYSADGVLGADCAFWGEVTKVNG